MRFTHTADCHIGGHRDPKLRLLTEQAFVQFVDQTLQLNVEFAVIAGDLFNTAIPGIDTLKFTVTQLGRLRDAKIPVYVIPGSHDYSPNGKTMIDVFEQAGLLRNVCRGTITPDGKLQLAFTIGPGGVKITGVIGRRGMLDREIYEDLDMNIANEPGKKIFLFHTAITELKPKNLAEMEGAPISFLPQGFDYYAGGHVHIVEKYDDAHYHNVVYPGPLFPNSFSELEQLRFGGFYYYNNGEIIRKDVLIKKVKSFLVSVDGMDVIAATKAINNLSEDVKDAIVLLRIEGELASGSPAELDLREVVHRLEQLGAYAVLRNTARLSSKDFVPVQLRSDDQSMIEELLLKEQADQLTLSDTDGVALASRMLRLLSQELQEGEKVHEYQDRMVNEATELLIGKDDGKD